MLYTNRLPQNKGLQDNMRKFITLQIGVSVPAATKVSEVLHNMTTATSKFVPYADPRATDIQIVDVDLIPERAPRKVGGASVAHKN